MSLTIGDSNGRLTTRQYHAQVRTNATARAVAARATPRPVTPRFRFGVTSDDGRRIVAERTRMLTADARAGARRLASAAYGSQAWVAAANTYLGAVQALRGDRAALAQVDDAAKADEVAPGNHDATTQAAWARDRIADIDHALAATSPARHGARDPDLIHPGERIVLKIRPTAPHIVTPTEAKLTVLDLAGRQAPHVATDAASINDPLRTLAAKDPIDYAVAALGKQHAGDAAWTSALAQGVPAARTAWTTARVTQQVRRGDLDRALDTLKVNLDAADSAQARQKLFDAAGKPFSTALLAGKLEAAIDQPEVGGSGKSSNYGERLAGQLLTDIGTHAPPEVAKMMVRATQVELSDPSGKLMNALRSDGGSGGPIIYAGLSFLTQRADQNGGTASVDVARIITRNLYADQVGMFARTASASDTQLGTSAEQATSLGVPALSVALVDQPASGDARVAVLQAGVRKAVTSGIRDFGGRIKHVGDTYEAADTEAVNLQENYAPIEGTNRAAQAIAADRSANVPEARAADVAYDGVRDAGVQTQQLLDSLKGLSVGSSAQQKALGAAVDALNANPTAGFAMSVAAGDNATNHPEDHYEAPLQTYLRNQVEQGMSSSSAPPAEPLPSQPANEARTPLQALGNLAFIARHAGGLYGLSGEAALAIAASVAVAKSGGLNAVLPSPLRGKGMPQADIQKALDNLAKPRNMAKVQRMAALMDADPALAKNLVTHLQQTLPKAVGAYQAHGATSTQYRAALYDLVHGYPDLGGGYENKTTATEMSASTTALKGLRTVAALVQTTNAYVNATQHDDTSLDRATDFSYVAAVGLWGLDGVAKTGRAAMGDSVGAGQIVQALDKRIAANPSFMNIAMKEAAEDLPGEFISGADVLLAVDTNKDLGASDPRSKFTDAIVGANTTALAMKELQSFAGRRAAAATADTLGGELTAGRAAGFLAGRLLPAAIPEGPVSAIVLGGGYYIANYMALKSSLEARRDPRYAAMVGQVTGIGSDQTNALMNESGGAFSSPSPLWKWLRVPYADRPVAKIVSGGVQPMDVLNQWSASRPGKQGDVQAWLPTLDTKQVSEVASIAGGIADHYIPRGSSTVSAKGLAVLEQRLRATKVVTCNPASGASAQLTLGVRSTTSALQCSSESLWSPILDQNRAVVDTPAAPATPTYQPPKLAVTTHVVEQGDTLWDLFGGRAGLDKGYRDLLPQFDPRREDGQF